MKRITTIAWGKFPTFKMFFDYLWRQQEVTPTFFEDMRGAGEWEAEEYV